MMNHEDVNCQYCDKGEGLYDAYCREADIDETSLKAKAKYDAFRRHVASCPNCGRKDGKK